MNGRVIWFALAMAMAIGCARPDLEDEAGLAKLDRAFFRCRVQPILARGCAFPACHGTEERFFHVYARNRLRLDAEMELNAPLTDEEYRRNYDAARALVEPEHAEASLLLSKPLDVRMQAGRFHRATELYGGGDVFLDQDDRDVRVIEQWIDGEKADADCVEPGSLL